MEDDKDVEALKDLVLVWRKKRYFSLAQELADAIQLYKFGYFSRDTLLEQAHVIKKKVKTMWNPGSKSTSTFDKAFQREYNQYTPPF